MSVRLLLLAQLFVPAAAGCTCTAGDAVTAEYTDGSHYGATINSMNADGTITVDWNDGDTEGRTVGFGQVNKNGVSCRAVMDWSDVEDCPPCLPSKACGSSSSCADQKCPDGGDDVAQINYAVEDCTCMNNGVCSDSDGTGFPWCWVDHAKCAFWTWSTYKSMAWKGCAWELLSSANFGRCACIPYVQLYAPDDGTSGQNDWVNCRVDSDAISWPIATPQRNFWCFVPEDCPNSQTSASNSKYKWAYCDKLDDGQATEDVNCDCELAVQTSTKKTKECDKHGDTPYNWCWVGKNCYGSIASQESFNWWKNCDSAGSLKATWNTCECNNEFDFYCDDHDGTGMIWCYTSIDCPGRTFSSTSGKFWKECEAVGLNKAIGGQEVEAVEEVEEVEAVEETDAAKQGDPCTEDEGPSGDCLDCECTSNDGGWDGTYSNCVVGPCCSNYCVKCSADGTYVGHGCPEAGSTAENGTGNGSGTNVNSALKACSFCTPLFAGLISAGMIHL